MSFDTSRILAEIEEDARALRRDGTITPEFERQLDSAFDRLSPPSTSNDVGQVVTSAEDLAYINADVPIESQLAAGAPVKKTMRRLMYWYVNYVTDQIQAFAVVATRGLRLLARRVDRLERAVPALDPRLRRELEQMPTFVDIEPWVASISAAMQGVNGRVIHGECGSGELVRALTDAGFDAYGVEPRLTAADAASASGVEVRDGDVLEHLRVVPDEVLGGVVLSGCIDVYPQPWQLAVLDEATRVLRPDGVLAFVTTRPEHWGTGATTVIADLAPGSPLRPETWQHLLGTRGYEGITISADDPGEAPSVLLTARCPTL